MPITGITVKILTLTTPSPMPSHNTVDSHQCSAWRVVVWLVSEVQHGINASTKKVCFIAGAVCIAWPRLCRVYIRSKFTVYKATCSFNLALAEVPPVYSKHQFFILLVNILLVKTFFPENCWCWEVLECRIYFIFITWLNIDNFTLITHIKGINTIFRYPSATKIKK